MVIGKTTGGPVRAPSFRFSDAPDLDGLKKPSTFSGSNVQGPIWPGREHILPGTGLQELLRIQSSGTATEALTRLGLPINPLNRALASNASVLRAEPWLKGAAIRGGARYMETMAEQVLPEGTGSLVRDAWFGKEAQALTPEVVKTVSAITHGVGERASTDVATINTVADMVGSHGKPQDYLGAYKALQASRDLLSR